MTVSIPFFLIMGEGKTDLGNKIPGKSGWELNPGPVYFFIDTVFEEIFKFSPYLTGEIENHFKLMTKSELKDYSNNIKNSQPRSIKLPGHKAKGMTIHGFKSRCLALKAKEISASEQVEIIPIYYTDADTIDNATFTEKLKDISTGFQCVNGSKGIAMVPKPTSESWILCVADSYANGAKYENAPTNDHSPNNLKKQVAVKLNCADKTAATQNELCQFIEQQLPLSVNKLCSELSSFEIYLENFSRSVT